MLLGYKPLWNSSLKRNVYAKLILGGREMSGTQRGETKNRVAQNTSRMCALKRAILRYFIKGLNPGKLADWLTVRFSLGIVTSNRGKDHTFLRNRFLSLKKH